MTMKKWDAERRINVYVKTPEDRERFNEAARRAGLERDRGAFLMGLVDSWERDPRTAPSPVSGPHISRSCFLIAPGLPHDCEAPDGCWHECHRPEADSKR